MLPLEEILGMASGSGFSREQLAGIALSLSKYREEIDTQLEVLKKILREEALKGAVPGESTIKIKGLIPGTETPIGEIWVTFSKPYLKAKKGANPTEIEGWNKFFEQKVSYALIKGSQPSLADWNSFVTLTEPTPRVSFKRWG